jgi:pyruvate/2-oxoglutarate dehydrogenase complex dihydrolipoamide acyltransferase (E2) component
MVVASAGVGREQNNIHAILEVDISEPRRLLAQHKQQIGESLSLTAYVIACLAQAVAAYPGLNAFRKGNQLILLEDVTISCLVERELDGENVPEPLGIQSAQAKTYRQIHEEICTAQ